MGDVAALDSVLDQVGGFFMGDSPIHRAAAAIAARLDELGIDYAVAGALCLAAHGVVRATEDVDILVTHPMSRSRTTPSTSRSSACR